MKINFKKGNENCFFKYNYLSKYVLGFLINPLMRHLIDYNDDIMLFSLLQPLQRRKRGECTIRVGAVLRTDCL